MDEDVLLVGLGQSRVVGGWGLSGGSAPVVNRSVGASLYQVETAV